MHVLLKECDSCNDLQSAYNKVECTILYLARNKDASLKYNVQVYFDQDLFNDLVRYKTILGKRLKSCTYPCSSIKTSDIIARANFLAFRDGNCSQCQTCFDEEPQTSSSSSTTTSTTTTSSTP